MADFDSNIDQIARLHPTGRPVKGVEYTFITDLAVEPVTVEDFKIHAKIDYNTDDRLVAMYLKAARQHLEEVAQLSFGERTVQLTALSLVDEWRVMYGPINQVLTGQTKSGRNTIVNSGGTNVSIEYTTKWPTGLPMDIVVAICRYAAGLYAIRENVILTDKGALQEPQNYLDEAEKMVMKYGNVTFI